MFNSNKQLVIRSAIIALLISVAYSAFFYQVIGSLSGKTLALIILPTVLILVLFQLALRRSLLVVNFIPHALVGISWTMAYPWFNNYCGHEGLAFVRLLGNYYFGLSIFALLCLGQYLLTQWTRCTRIVATIFTLLDFIVLLIPLAQLVYFIKEHHGLTLDTLFAIYQTNPAEAWEYLTNNQTVGSMLLIVVIWAIVMYLIYRINRPLALKIGPMAGEKLKIGVLTFLILTSVIFGVKTNIVHHMLGINAYMKSLQQYHYVHKDIYNDLQVNPANSTLTKTPGTIILVIGESASRDNMRVYNPNTPFPDTPWMSKERADNPDFIFFDHAYSSYVQTVPSLERALTEMNQYDNKNFMDSASIVDVAKKLGYKTYWFSNQGIFGTFDTTTTLIAKTADKTQWAHHAMSGTNAYDGALIPLLHQVNPQQNNFIVIHVMGNHLGYKLRYPSSFEKFSGSKLANYYNSMLYGDYVLQQIYDYGKQHLNLQAMIYFSDHAEDMKLSHNPDIFTWAMARIPMWIYLSPQYQREFAPTVQQLRSHEHQYFTNDLLYDLVVGILHADSNRYDPSRDFSSPQYRFNEHNLMTMFGKYKLTQDPNYQRNDLPVSEIFK